MKAKKRIFLFVILLFLLVLIIAGNLKRSKLPTSDEGITYAKNEYTVYNQGESILEYGDFAYFVDNYSNSIYRFNKQNSSTEQIVTSSNAFEKKLFVINNNLIFATNNVTYYISLNDNKNREYKKFVDGKVMYITEDLCLYVKETESTSYLYISSYNSETFLTTNNIFYTLAKGYNINFLKQLGDELYFTSTNSDNSVSLFSVDLKQYKTTLIVREFLEENDGTVYLEFNDVAKNDSEIYYVLSTNEPTNYGLPHTRYYLYSRNIKYAYKEFVSDDVIPFLYTNPQDESEILYQRYVDYSVEPVWNGEVTDWKEFIYGDVTRFFEIDNSKLILDGKTLIDLNQDYEWYNVELVSRINGTFYVLLSDDDEIHSWYSCNEDGSNLHEIKK